jgi:Beta-lactamase
MYSGVLCAQYDSRTAGFYSTPNDVSKYLRSILSAQLLPKSAISAWLKPQSWTDSGTSSAYGLGWEFLRTTRLTYDGRPLEIISKAGALHGYNSWVMLLPEFGLGLSVMVAGTVNTMEVIREAVIKAMIPLIEAIARKRAVARYTGLYRLDNAESRSYIRINIDQYGPGLYIAEWMYDGKDFLSFYGGVEGMPTYAGLWTAKLTPANIPETTDNLEMWRVVCVNKNESDMEGNIFGDFHLTDIDDINYGQHGLGDIRIVLDENSHAFEIHIPALDMRMRRIIGEPNSVDRLSKLGDFYPSFEL